MAVPPATPIPTISPVEMQILVSRAGLVLNPGQVADLVLAWRQIAGMIAGLPRDRRFSDDMAMVFRLAPPEGFQGGTASKAASRTAGAKPVAKASPGKRGAKARPAAQAKPAAKAQPKAGPAAKVPQRKAKPLAKAGASRKAKAPGTAKAPAKVKSAQAKTPPRKAARSAMRRR